MGLKLPLRNFPECVGAVERLSIMGRVCMLLRRWRKSTTPQSTQTPLTARRSNLASGFCVGEPWASHPHRSHLVFMPAPPSPFARRRVHRGHRKAAGVPGTGWAFRSGGGFRASMRSGPARNRRKTIRALQEDPTAQESSVLVPRMRRTEFLQHPPTRPCCPCHHIRCTHPTEWHGEFFLVVSPRDGSRRLQRREEWLVEAGDGDLFRMALGRVNQQRAAIRSLPTARLKLLRADDTQRCPRLPEGNALHAAPPSNRIKGVSYGR
jgi:hypothetical protein